MLTEQQFYHLRGLYDAVEDERRVCAERWREASARVWDADLGMPSEVFSAVTAVCDASKYDELLREVEEQLVHLLSREDCTSFEN